MQYDNDDESNVYEPKQGNVVHENPRSSSSRVPPMANAQTREPAFELKSKNTMSRKTPALKVGTLIELMKIMF